MGPCVSTPAPKEDPPLTPEDVVGVLQSRGWEATIVTEDECPISVVDVNPNGILKCVDGRGSDNKAMAGPKMLGGVYGIANCRGIKTAAELGAICREVKAAGHVPSVHGDESGIMGCGFCKLWVTDGFADAGLGIEPPSFTAEEGRDAVKAAGGTIENHYGAHAEKIVYINFISDKTLEPDHDDQRFIVDAWAAAKFNLDIPKYLVTAAVTVEKLAKGQLKKAILVVPNKPPLTPQDVVGVLQSRGWEATIVKAADSPIPLVDVNPKGILKCVDGRGSDNKAMAGPKMLGGVYGIANCRGIKTSAELGDICKEVKAAGHVPSVHGDESGILGCGFCKLWVTDGFADAGLGIEKPNFSAQEGADAVKAAGGVIENHYGAHAEKIVYINFVEGKTLEPDHDDQRFIVDAWAAAKFKLNVPKYLVTAAVTVEKLAKGQLKKAVLII
jgi:hypothetical protein